MTKILASLLALTLLVVIAWTVFVLTRGDRPVVVAKGNHSKKDKDEKRRPRFTIGKETSYVDGPLDEEGYIDYSSALNKRLSEGVTPENNAVVVLWKALGPKFADDKMMPPEFFQLLGMPAPPEKGHYFIDLSSFVKERLGIDPNRLDFNGIERTERRPWAPKDHPIFAAWITANEKPLDLIIDASRRPRFFSPWTPSRTRKGLLYSNALDGWEFLKCRHCASVLATRAMLQLGQGHPDEAWQDLLTCHRLGRVMTRGGTLMQFLVGRAIDNVASDADLAFLQSAKLEVKQITACLADLQALSPFPGMADRFDVVERFFFLDTVLMIDRYGLEYFDELYAGLAAKLPESLTKLFRTDLPEPVVPLFAQEIDWDPALRAANQWFDRVAAALREKDRPQREQHLAKLAEDRQRLRTQVQDAEHVKKVLEGAAALAQVRGKIAGDALLTLESAALPDQIRRIQHGADRAEQIQRNLHVAFALAAYQRNHGRYPSELEALAPKYLGQVPQDIFSGKQLIYRPSENGYWLQSVGPDGRDDDGRNEDDDPPGDDVVIRMPLPKLTPRSS